MKFACIQDCSRCPFNCMPYRQEQPKLPKVMVEPINKEVPESEENKKNELIPMTENLPEVTDAVEYEVFDDKKKKYFWSKK